METGNNAMPGVPGRPIPGNRVRHPRGLFGQIRMALLQPGLFFQTLPASNSQHWLIAAFLILALIGVSAIRQQELASGSPSFNVPSDSGTGDSGQTPGGTDTTNAVTPDISTTWKPALTAASEVVVNWIFLGVLLIIVSVSRSSPPRFGLNVKIVIWASLPLGLMAALQLLYYSSGGMPGKPGLAGLVSDLPGFGNLPTFTQALLVSLGSRLTLFWLWSLILVYLGARHTLGGMRLVIALVLLLWIVWLVFLPVAINSLNNPHLESVPTLMPLTTEGP